MKNWTFESHFCDHLPADPEQANYTRQVSNACYSWTQPTKVRQPSLIAHAKEVTDLFGLNENDIQSQEFADVFSGNALLAGMNPYAMRYAGHQFGNWAGQLGDGRAINLGESRDQNQDLWTLQLKGSGKTPYSRHADGLAVLRSSVREFLCSEAMHHLGIPTTRAMSLCLTGEDVMRDMFYDGRPEYEKGAIVCRVAPSFIRFGNFEMHASTGEKDILQKLIDYTIQNHFKHLGKPSLETTLAWFDEVCRRTITMVSHWMRVGFVHGVMNTDNLSILGLTIDYGPYGWLEDYDLNWTPNTTDAQGKRYAYAKQPGIVMWNLYQLGNALLTILDDRQALQDILEKHGQTTLSKEINTMLAKKLGFQAWDAETNQSVVDELNLLLQMHETDMTIFYRQLAEIDLSVEPDSSSLDVLSSAYYQVDTMSDEARTKTLEWLKAYSQAFKAENVSQEERKARMNKQNPKYVLRNYLAQLAIDEADQGNYSKIHELQKVLRNPYSEQDGKGEFYQKRPDWAKERAGCSMLSCSS